MVVPSDWLGSRFTTFIWPFLKNPDRGDFEMNFDDPVELFCSFSFLQKSSFPSLISGYLRNSVRND